jgi:hypothetical protein
VFWHKTIKGIIVELSESGLGGMVTVSHEANTNNDRRSNPELLCCAISGSEFEQSRKTSITGARFSEKEIRFLHNQRHRHIRSLAAAAEANSTVFSKVRGGGDERRPGARASAKVLR